MGDEHDRPPLVLELLDPVEALALEPLVPHGQDLVDDEDVGVDVDRHGEAQPDVHPRRVELHLVVDELLELGEGHDLVEDLVDVAPRQPEQRAVQVDVLAPGELGLEARPELEQAGQAAADHDLALRSAGGPRRRT